MASLGSLFGYSQTTEVAKAQVTLIEDAPVESTGKFNIQGTVRIVQPWTRSVAPGSVAMSLSIVGGDGRAGFGTLNEATGGFDYLGSRISIMQHGDFRKPAGVFYMVTQGVQTITQTLKPDRSIVTQPGEKNGFDVVLQLDVEGKKSQILKYNTLTKMGEAGVRPERVRHAYIQFSTVDGEVDAVMDTFVKKTPRDCADDAALACWNGTDASVRFLGSTASGTVRGVGAAIANIGFTIIHPIETAKGLRNRTILALGGQPPVTEGDSKDK